MRSHSARLLLACALVALTCAGFGSTVHAQNFNLDYGEDPVLTSFPLPLSTYGGAANQPGVWVGLTDGVSGQAAPPVSSPWYVGSNLADVNNFVTGVSTSAMITSNTNSVGDFVFDNASTTGDDERLMDDVADIGSAVISPQPFMVVTFTGLATGSYDVYTYAWAPDSSTFTTRVAADNSTGAAQTCGGAWPGSHVLGTTYTLHTVSVCTGTITITTTSISGFGSINGIQIKQVGPATCITTFCDGTVASCPCALSPQGAAPSGCATEAGTDGATLLATGNASVSADTAATGSTGNPGGTVQLNMTGAIPNTSATIFLQGTTTAAGVPFYDGLRCVAGQLTRLNGQVSTLPPFVSAGDNNDPNGDLTYPTGKHFHSISQRMDPTFGFPGPANSPGTTYHYFVFYRVPSPNVCVVSLGGAGNTTNAVSIPWGP